MAYDDRLLSGADPLYAPGMDQGRYWKAPARYVKAGYALKRVRLEGDDLEKAAMCRALTREMLEWYEGAEKVEAGTWQWLIGRYKGDEFSPFRDVKDNTQKDYQHRIARLEATIGPESLADWNHVRIKTWERAMKDAGQSDDYVKKQATMLRILINYGVVIESPDCARLSAIMSKMQFKSPPQRRVAMTRAQAEAVIAAADRAGHTSFGTGLMLMFECALRAVDVRGQWLSAEGADGGIVRNGRRWADGLTWDMIDPETRFLRKVTSKTGAEVEFDLSELPVLQARLKAIPRRAGPVILTKSGAPYTVDYWKHQFARFREAAGVPDHVWMMDARAGAITEAKQVGASPADIRDLAGHSDLATTNRYMRGQADAAGRVVKLRQGRAG